MNIFFKGNTRRTTKGTAKGIAGGISAVAGLAGLIFFLRVLSRILTGFRRPDPGDLACIIVLGAHVRKNGPCRALRYRLDTAADYLKEHPKAFCIVSGGRGADEPCSEASCMKQYLADQGIPEERIFLEDRSRTTRENILYSCRILEENGLLGRTGLVTNDFHMYRALRIARENGLEDPAAVTAPSTPLFLPRNILREFLAMIKYYLQNFRKDRCQK